MVFKKAVSLVIGGAVLFGIGLAVRAQEQPKPLFRTDEFRPIIVFQDLPTATSHSFVSIAGVVFSRAPVDSVTVSERSAQLRQAEPKDLVKLQRVPPGAVEMPFRTVFEVVDAALAKPGPNTLVIVASSSDGRVSETHRLTIVRVQSPPAANR